MPNWKKVIVSGSNATLAQISASVVPTATTQNLLAIDSTTGGIMQISQTNAVSDNTFKATGQRDGNSSIIGSLIVSGSTGLIKIENDTIQGPVTVPGGLPAIVLNEDGFEFNQNAQAGGGSAAFKINTTNENVDFIVHGKTVNNLLKVDAVDSKVEIRNSLSVLGDGHITASGNIKADGDLAVGGNIFSFSGFSFIQGFSANFTGSNVFGSGSTPSANDIAGGGTAHQFTGSVAITGSGALDIFGGGITIHDGNSTFNSPVITLGANELARINLNGYVATSVDFRGDITSSGNISSSKNIYASQYNVDGKVAFDTDPNHTQGRVFPDPTLSSIQIGRNGSPNKNIELLGPVTASGAISASGTLLGAGLNINGPANSHIEVGTYNVGFDTANASGYMITGSGLIISGAMATNHHNMLKIGNVELVDVKSTSVPPVGDEFLIHNVTTFRITSGSDGGDVAGTNNGNNIFVHSGNEFFLCKNGEAATSGEATISSKGTTTQITDTNINLNGQVSMKALNLLEEDEGGGTDIPIFSSAPDLAAAKIFSLPAEVFLNHIGGAVTASAVSSSGELSLPGFPNVSASLAALTAGTVGDNLGNHTATEALNMAGNNITNALNISASGFISSSDLVVQNDALINGLTIGRGGGANVQNTAIGNLALLKATEEGNTAVGASSMQLSPLGKLNTAVGQRALYQTKASNNTSIGQDSLYNHVIGNNNVALGLKAGKNITGGSNPLNSASFSTFIGMETKAKADDETNQIVIGYDATGEGSNSVVLGNDSITKTVLKGNITASGNISSSGDILTSDNIKALGVIKGKLRHQTHHNMTFANSDNLYIPINNISPKANVEKGRNAIVAPHDGTFKGAKILTDNNAGNCEINLDINGVLTTSPGTTAIGANTVVTIIKAFNFSADDILAIKFDPQNNPGGVSITCLWEYNTLT